DKFIISSLAIRQNTDIVSNVKDKHSGFGENMSINHTLKTQPVTPAHIQQEVKFTQRNLANSPAKEQAPP
ncbi:MAG: hypothetical protein E7H57_04370, partial [Pantoea sp.]|nr:hypothetical protein [Pantoea sp.]